jgi:hypothetical protein
MVGILFFSVGNYWSSHWYMKWVYLLGMLMLYFSVWVSSKTSWWFLPLMLCVSASTLLFGAYGLPAPLRLYKPPISNVVGRDTFYAFSVLSLFGVVLATAGMKLLWSVHWFLKAVFVVGCVWVMTKLDAPLLHRGGFSGNPSMHASIICCTMPFLFVSKKSAAIAVAMALAVMYFVHESIPIGVFSVVVLSYAFAKMKWKSLWLLIPVAAVFVVGYLDQKERLFNGSGRFETWGVLFQWWWKNVSPWTGYGIGASVTTVPIIQKMIQDWRWGFFLWIHCDYLQLLFEGGVLMLVSALLAAGAVAIKSFHSPRLFASWMGMCALSAVNYPLHLPVHALVGMCLVYLAVREPVCISCRVTGKPLRGPASPSGGRRRSGKWLQPLVRRLPWARESQETRPGSCP